MSLENYLNSKEALDHLCQIEPDKPIRYGIGKLGAGLGLASVSGVVGYFGWKITEDMVTDFRFSNNTLFKIMSIGCGIVAGAITLLSGGYGLYLLADAATSLAKPFGIYSKEEGVYYRNGGFTNKISFSDKKFGTKINPIENVSDLILNQKGEIFLNGFIVKNTKLSEAEKSRTNYIQAGKVTVPMTENYTEYTLIVNGEFKNKPIKVFTVTENESFAKKLADKPKDSILYVKGELDEDGDIKVDQWGNAFTMEDIKDEI